MIIYGLSCHGQRRRTYSSRFYHYKNQKKKNTLIKTLIKTQRGSWSIRHFGTRNMDETYGELLSFIENDVTKHDAVMRDAVPAKVKLEIINLLILMANS